MKSFYQGAIEMMEKIGDGIGSWGGEGAPTEEDLANIQDHYNRIVGKKITGNMTPDPGQIRDPRIERFLDNRGYEEVARANANADMIGEQAMAQLNRQLAAATKRSAPTSTAMSEPAKYTSDPTVARNLSDVDRGDSGKSFFEGAGDWLRGKLDVNSLANQGSSGFADATSGVGNFVSENPLASAGIGGAGALGLGGLLMALRKKRMGG